MKEFMKIEGRVLLIVAGLFLLIGNGCVMSPSVAENERLNYSKEQKQWGLATSAVLTRCNRHDFFSLTGVADNKQGTKDAKYILSNCWSVYSRAQLINTLQSLTEKGHRASYQMIRREFKKPPEERELDFINVSRIAFVEKYSEQQLGEHPLMGWDLARVISLARWGVSSGYLEKNEAWDWIMPAAQKIQKTYSSWKEVGESYLLGREFWSVSQMRKNGYDHQQAVFWLTSNEHSPWKQFDWNLDLTGSPTEFGDESHVPETELFYEGISYVKSDQFKKAIEILEVAKNQGRELSRGNACCWLGRFYQYGLFEVEINQERAFELFEEGARLNHAGCLFALGWANYSGSGRPKNYQQALELWTRGAEQGDPDSLCDLGILYDSGRGVEKDLGMAMEIYRKAMTIGAESAANNAAWAMYKNEEIWNPDEAIRLAYNAVRRSECGAHYDTLSKVLIKAEHWPEAWAVLDKWEKYELRKADNFSESGQSKTIHKLRARINESWVLLNAPSEQ